MLDVDPVPACGDPQVRDRQEGSQVVEDQLVDPRLVERLDGVAILVRVADHQLAAAFCGNQDMDALADMVGQLGVQAPDQRRAAWDS